MHPAWRIVVAVAVLWAGADWWQHRPIARTPGVLIAEAPEQIDLPGNTPAFRFQDFSLRPLARYRIAGRVLASSRYRFDAGAALAPYDLGLGWDRMSDSAVIDQLNLRQSGRFLLWHWSELPPLPEAEIEASASNTHLIPANSVIAGKIAALRVGELAELTGSLVEANRDDGWHWRSSLTRKDSGGGACELMWVESVRVLPRPLPGHPAASH